MGVTNWLLRGVCAASLVPHAHGRDFLARSQPAEYKRWFHTRMGVTQYERAEDVAEGLVPHAHGRDTWGSSAAER